MFGARSEVSVLIFLRPDPLADGRFLETPMGTDFEAGQLANRSMLIDRQRLHA